MDDWLNSDAHHVDEGRRFNADLRLRDGHIALTQASATLFKVCNREFLREGRQADRAIVDPDRPHTLTQAEILSCFGWSPFEGESFNFSNVAGVINGVLDRNNGQLDDGVRGQRLEIDR